MDVNHLQEILDMILFNTSLDRVECNWCSRDDYVFSENSVGLHGIADRLLAHASEYHPEVELARGPSDEELAGVQRSVGHAIRTLAPAPPTAISRTDPEEGT